LPQEVSRHGDRINSQHEARFENIDQTHLRSLFDEIRMLNPCAGELRIAGMELSQGRPVRPILNDKVMVSEVASLTADSTVGERKVRFKLKNQPAQEIGMRSELSEPLSYPLLFTNFENG
jgi:hypothetical protein